MLTVLRLGNSQDTAGPIPEEERAHAIGARLLSEAAGQPVTTVQRTIWPAPVLPSLVEGWLDRYQPDIVFLYVASVWTCYESVSLRVRELLGPLGIRASHAFDRLDTRTSLHTRPGMRQVRSLLHHTVGRAAYFEPEEIVERMAECVRLVLRREGPALVVRGPVVPLYVDLPGLRARADARHRQLHLGLQQLCARLHFPYLDEQVYRPDAEEALLREPDRLHFNAAGHRVYGAADGAGLIAALRQHGRLPSLTAG